MEIALQYMLSKGNGIAGKQMTMRIISKIMGEAIEDMYESGIHPEIAALYIKQLSAMTYWIAEGTWNTNIPVPEDFDFEVG